MNISTYLGSGLASLCVMSVATFGWRAAYYIIGGSGVLLSAAALLFIKEPERGYQVRLSEEKKKKEERKEKRKLKDQNMFVEEAQETGLLEYQMKKLGFNDSSGPHLNLKAMIASF